MDEPRYEQGMRTRREVLGDVHVDRSLESQTDFDAGFQRFITEYAWGTVWSNDTLDRETRSLITIAILASLGRTDELALHVRASQNIGVPAEKIAEAMHHVAIYAGVPAANTGFKIAREILQPGES
ncbi:MAG: 4-carboxymuconolactone decarboxylase [Thermomicrobiaceae bacterium]